ncbi:GmrSD restriction endonuclease domain-containing protein [Lacrimispora indolis]|uniref:GmrSD restriction endonuclease domain-containing protein n=1 Tax=Lacrimispora indolis TaxID=69825 RepID=UPI0003F9D773|nr:DUF262 domain-containing protein [[Clostridium] methoxybenzovorans]
MSILYNDETEDQELAVNESVYGIHHKTESTNIRTLITSWNDGELLIPKFQRRFVWTIEQASSFIESLMMELPIPTLMIYKDENQFQYIIDGQQRIKSILYFIGELDENSVSSDDKKFVKFKLKGLEPNSQYFEKTYNGVNSFNETQQRKLKNLTLPVTTITLDNPENIDQIYSIFNRLNTCGTPLTAQEIRYCVYSGSFNDFIYELNENETWQEFFTNKTDHTRQKDAELILRFFALHEQIFIYKKPMKAFLSNYFKEKRALNGEELEEKRNLFISTVESIHTHLGDNPFNIKNGLNSSVADSLLIAFSHNLDNIPYDIKHRYFDLIENSEYDFCISQSANDVKSVKRRIELAEEILFKSSADVDLKIIKLYEVPASAGLGNWLDDDNLQYDEIETSNRRADFALRISGDSMSPQIMDGDIVLIQRQSTIRSGKIGIFTYKNNIYCKKFVKSRATYLSSINQKYKTIKVEEEDQFFVNGLVVEILPKEIASISHI